jgi:hypothetical protein
MAIIPQETLFGWEDDIEDLGDLARLKLVMDHLPDEALMTILEKERGQGRDDFPIRPMWNLMLAGFLFGHDGDASLLRELRRNGQLKHVCGFGFGKTPKAHNLSRFKSLLLHHLDEVEAIFAQLRGHLYEQLEGFGAELAIDSKWVESAANRPSKQKNPDGRSETEAKKGVKSYSGIREDGSTWERTVTCFGYKIHLLVDTKYELPIAYRVTDAAASDITEGKKLFDELKEKWPGVIDTARYLTADKGYDDTGLITWLKGNEVKSVIDKRTMWRTEKEKAVPGYDDAYYDEAGNVYCYTKDKGFRRMMAPNGYEAKRDAVRFKCPAKAYGRECAEQGECRCKNIRIPLATDPRIFTQVQRESKRWKRFYNKRTAVERVNSRFDVTLGFEGRRVRGKKRMELNTGLALNIMLAMAVGRIANNQEGLIRSLIRVA